MNTEVHRRRPAKIRPNSPERLPARLLRALTGMLYPPRCAICRSAGFNGMDICEPCHRELPWIASACTQCALPLAHDAPAGSLCGRCQKRTPHFDTSICLFSYERSAMQLVQQLKFNQRLALSRLLGEMLSHQVSTHQDVIPGCIVPVPLYRKRLRKRGFNQSIELARPLAQSLGIPIDLNSVVRGRDTRPQTGLDRDSRRRNIKGAFEVVATPASQHVALIDDVVTTGSTVNELARVLKRAGVKRVDVWSIARAV